MNQWSSESGNTRGECRRGLWLTFSCFKDHEFEVLAQDVHLRIEPDSCILGFNFAIMQK